MTARLLTTKLFSSSDQERFARLSGDYNPLHMDVRSARRTQAGVPLVHGVHTLLWSLEQLLAGPVPVNRLKVRFAKPVCLGDSVSLFEQSRDNGNIRAQLMVQGAIVSSITIGLGERPKTPAPETGSEQTDNRAPTELLFKDIKAQSGWLDYSTLVESNSAAFPVATNAMGASTVAALTCCSRLIGMVCPGLHSIFVGLDIELLQQAPPHGIQFRVCSTDERFRAVKQSIFGGGIRGTVDSLVRFPPITQASMAEVSRLVAPDEFKGSAALIIGGTRGLGEITAKIVAAGGGRPVITYSVGREEADQVSQQIHAANGLCDIVHYDVRKPAEEQLDSLSRLPEHLYYFATPAIFRHKGRLFTQDLFDDFALFYLQAFAKLCYCLHARVPGGVRIFYPSSIAVEERPADMTEYAMAKAAGEILCADMNRFLSGMQILVRRLPRILTDQTASVISVDSMSALDVMAPIVRQLHKR